MSEIQELTKTQQSSSITVQQSFSMGIGDRARVPQLPSNRSLAGQLRELPRPAWLPKAQWPFQTMGLESEGTTIAVTDVGRGPVLLFVHTGFWSFIWRDVILRLAADFRCVWFDAPGTGQSERLPVARISLERASRALTTVVHALNLTDITLVFHDLGGPSGIAGAARVPDRLRGLCAVNAFAWKPSGATFRGMLALMGSAVTREFDAFTGILPRITASAFGVGRHMDEQSRQVFLSGIGRQGARAFHGYMRDARTSQGIYEQVQHALNGPFRQLPLLTIFGQRNDPLGFQPGWKKLFPDAQQVVVSKGNHFPMCDDPDLVASSIREFYRDRIAPTLGRGN
jgi:pimeloyl-ACP methyl ester carboxylesterase